MFTQESKPRRKPMTYGRAKRSQHTFMPLDFDDPPDVRNSTSSGVSLVNESPPAGRIFKSVEVQIPSARKLVSVRRSPTQKAVRALSSSPAGNLSSDSILKEDTTFDIPSSGDDDDLGERKVQKRRKLTPVADPIAEIAAKSKGHARGTSRANLKANGVRNGTRPASKSLPKATRGVLRTTRKTETPSPKTSRASSPVEDVAPHATPKRAKIPMERMFQSPSDSPSRIPITSLSLSATPDVAKRFKDMVGIDSVPQPKTRKRLIDGMGSPAKPSSLNFSSSPTSQESSDDAWAVPEEVSNLSAIENKQLSPKKINFAENDAPSTEPARVAIAKPRMTYSKERSHLSDMILEEPPVGMQTTFARGGAAASQDLPLMTSFDSLAHEFSDDEDDLEAPGIRSIHELRQAGSSARSRIDIGTLLEDIESKGTSARSQRLRGLVQLAKKLEIDVGPSVLEQGLEHRLRKCPSLQGDDIVGQTLVMLCLTRLLASAELPASSLEEVFETSLQLGDRLLTESRDIAQLARDRTHKVSKSLAKDISQLSEKVRKSSLWPEPPIICSPQLVHVKFLDLVLRQARKKGDFGMFLPASTLDQLIKLLLNAGCDTQDDGGDSPLLMDLTVSILESLTISSNWAQEGCFEAVHQLAQLGPILSQFSSSEDSRRSQHLILRLLLNITNNDPGLCDSFSEPALLRALFEIVRSDLEASAFSGGVLTESRLESVILALGALCNLAEHSAAFRKQTLKERIGSQSMSDWLATTFRDQVGASAEASSVEQATSFVAFGYLSVLLCNLCLDKQIRSQVRKLLKGSLHQLLDFVQEFLGHFRKVEALSESQALALGEGGREGESEGGKDANSHFAERFEGVLNVLREAEVNG